MEVCYWLVVSTHLKTMKVNWDDDIPNIWKNQKNVPNHQPEMGDTPVPIVSIRSNGIYDLDEIAPMSQEPHQNLPNSLNFLKSHVSENLEYQKNTSKSHRF